MITGKKIKDMLADRNITAAELSRKTGIPATTLRSMMSKDTTPKVDMLEKIASALGLYVHELMETGDDFDSLLARPQEEIEIYKKSLRKNIEDLRASREKDLLDFVSLTARRLNDDGLRLLYRIAKALASTESLVKEGELLNVYDDDSIEASAQGSLNGGETEEN